MTKNLTKRIITSIFLLSILIYVNFSHQFIFLLSLLVLSLIVCIELNNIYSKLLNSQFLKNVFTFKKKNF